VVKNHNYSFHILFISNINLTGLFLGTRQQYEAS